MGAAVAAWASLIGATVLVAGWSGRHPQQLLRDALLVLWLGIACLIFWTFWFTRTAEAAS